MDAGFNTKDGILSSKTAGACSREIKHEGCHSSSGDEEPSCSSEGGSHSRLLVFRFGECDVIKQYIISLAGSGARQVTLEESCDLYIQQRFNILCLLLSSYLTLQRRGHF